MEPSTKAFSDRLKRAIAVSGLSRTEIADELNVTRQAIGNWLQEGTMHRSRIVPFCDLCRVDVRWLLTGEGDAALKVLPNRTLALEALADDIADRLSVSDQIAVVMRVLARTHQRLT